MVDNLDSFQLLKPAVDGLLMIAAPLGWEERCNGDQ